MPPLGGAAAQFAGKPAPTVTQLYVNCTVEIVAWM